MTHLPSAHELSANHEYAILAALDAALTMARLTLLCKYPDIRQCEYDPCKSPKGDDALDLQPPHPSTLVAELIINSCEEMQTLLEAYRQSVNFECSVHNPYQTTF